MAFKAAGPCDLFREHMLLNPASFATSNPTDDWRQEAHGFISAQRSLVRDATANGQAVVAVQTRTEPEIEVARDVMQTSVQDSHDSRRALSA